MSESPRTKNIRLTMNINNQNIEKQLISELRAGIDYNPETGKLVWKKGGKGVIVGSECGSITRQGYRRMRFNGKRYYAHRIAFAIYYGYFPSMQVDHINQIKGDNRIINLRNVTHAENSHNSSKQINNKSGFLGVYWHKTWNKWVAHVTFFGKRRYKSFSNKYQAVEWATERRKELHGVFASH